METVAGNADLLMECEEQLEKFSPPPVKHKDKEARMDEGGGAELRLHSHPEGSASGFTTIQIPVTLTLHSPSGVRYITTTASLTATSSSAPPPASGFASCAPGPEPIPIITGVVSGEAAKKVLNDHSVILNSISQKSEKTPPSAGTPTSKPKKSRSKPRPSRIAAPDKLLRKGEIGAAIPPDCLICKSQYKLITELRGFMCVSPVMKLMDHMQQHVSMLSQGDGHIDTVSTCQNCFRHFPSPFSLQHHIKDVHSHESAVMCKICELAFDNEPALLCHMKNTHKPGEMPYACQVCEFQSSFYSDVWSHFREAHSDTGDLLCRYCLRVLHSNTCYQQHFARHQNTKRHIIKLTSHPLSFADSNPELRYASSLQNLFSSFKSSYSRNKLPGEENFPHLPFSQLNVTYVITSIIQAKIEHFNFPQNGFDIHEQVCS
ncbi:hypothetical protein XENOCAPTIV_006574, partial [Xenoophorus captivus]